MPITQSNLNTMQKQIDLMKKVGVSQKAISDLEKAKSSAEKVYTSQKSSSSSSTKSSSSSTSSKGSSSPTVNKLQEIIGQHIEAIETRGNAPPQVIDAMRKSADIPQTKTKTYSVQPQGSPSNTPIQTSQTTPNWIGPMQPTTTPIVPSSTPSIPGIVDKPKSPEVYGPKPSIFDIKDKPSSTTPSNEFVGPVYVPPVETHITPSTVFHAQETSSYVNSIKSIRNTIDKDLDYIVDDEQVSGAELIRRYDEEMGRAIREGMGNVPQGVYIEKEGKNYFLEEKDYQTFQSLSDAQKRKFYQELGVMPPTPEEIQAQRAQERSDQLRDMGVSETYISTLRDSTLTEAPSSLYVNQPLPYYTLKGRSMSVSPDIVAPLPKNAQYTEEPSITNPYASLYKKTDFTIPGTISLAEKKADEVMRDVAVIEARGTIAAAPIIGAGALTVATGGLGVPALGWAIGTASAIALPTLTQEAYRHSSFLSGEDEYKMVTSKEFKDAVDYAKYKHSENLSKENIAVQFGSFIPGIGQGIQEGDLKKYVKEYYTDYLGYDEAMAKKASNAASGLNWSQAAGDIAGTIGIETSSEILGKAIIKKVTPKLAGKQLGVATKSALIALPIAGFSEGSSEYTKERLMEGQPLKLYETFDVNVPFTDKKVSLPGGFLGSGAWGSAFATTAGIPYVRHKVKASMLPTDSFKAKFHEGRAKAILGAVYALDPFEPTGDWLGGKIAAGGIKPKVITFTGGGSTTFAPTSSFTPMSKTGEAFSVFHGFNPSFSPIKTFAPSPVPTKVSSTSLTPSPSYTPVPATMPSPSFAPGFTPIQVPSEVPTEVPSETETTVPTSVPQSLFSPVTIHTPAMVPTTTFTPSTVPSEVPTQVPSEVPTQVPTTIPTPPIFVPPGFGGAMGTGGGGGGFMHGGTGYRFKRYEAAIFQSFRPQQPRPPVRESEETETKPKVVPKVQTPRFGTPFRGQMFKPEIFKPTLRQPQKSTPAKSKKLKIRFKKSKKKVK